MSYASTRKHIALTIVIVISIYEEPLVDLTIEIAGSERPSSYRKQCWKRLVFRSLRKYVRCSPFITSGGGHSMCAVERVDSPCGLQVLFAGHHITHADLRCMPTVSLIAFEGERFQSIQTYVTHCSASALIKKRPVSTIDSPQEATLCRKCDNTGGLQTPDVPRRTINP